MEIAEMTPGNATAAERQAWYDVYAASYAEDYPGEPVAPQRAAWLWKTAAPGWQPRTFWLARDEAGSLLGWASMRRELRGSNQHRAEVEVHVQPSARRRGVGTALVSRVAHVAREGGATVLGFVSKDRPGPIAFLASIGATSCLAETRSLLDFDALDIADVTAGAQRPASAGDYTLVRLAHDMSDDDLGQLARIYTVMNTAPRGEMTMNDEAPDPLARRDWLHLVRDAGDEYVTFCARHEPSGQLAGFTMVRVHTSSWPGHGFQEDTGVDPGHRGHGLGLWLKCAMLVHLLAEHPLLRRLETWNAEENEHMLRINRRLGYFAATVGCQWEISGPALDKLAQRS